MLDALSNSSGNIFASHKIWSWGGLINDTMLEPLLRTTSKLLMSCLIFQISTFLLAALGSSAVFSLPPRLGPSLWQQSKFLPGAGSDVGHSCSPVYIFISCQDLKSIKTLKLPKTKRLVQRVKQTGLQ